MPISAPRIQAFENAASYCSQGGVTQEVGVNRYAILKPDAPQTMLFTRYANICTGLALFAEDGTAGMMHLLSDPSVFSAGEEKLQRHAAEAFSIFHASMDTKNRLRGVLFGAWQRSNAIINNLPEKMAEYDAMSKAHNEILQLQCSEREKDGENIVFEDRMQRYFRHRDETVIYNDYKQKPETRLLADFMNRSVSACLADALAEEVRSCGQIEIVADYRYQDAPHDALYDRNQNVMIVDKTNGFVEKQIPMENVWTNDTGIRLPSLGSLKAA